MDNLELLRALSGQFGVSGFEGEVREWIGSTIRDWVDALETDALGNLMAKINPDRDFVLMLDAHMEDSLAAQDPSHGKHGRRGNSRGRKGGPDRDCLRPLPLYSFAEQRRRSQGF